MPLCPSERDHLAEGLMLSVGDGCHGWLSTWYPLDQFMQSILAVSATEVAMSVVTVKLKAPRRVVGTVSCIPASSPEWGARPRCQSPLSIEVASQLCAWSFPSFFFWASSVSLSSRQVSGMWVWPSLFAAFSKADRVRERV